MNSKELQEKLFSVDESNFESLALEIFRFQFENNSIYATFSKGIGKNPQNVNRVEEIPFLPVELFKSHRIYSSEKLPEVVFSSSGTSAMATSRHEVADSSLYRKSFRSGFRKFYGQPGNWVILALLPSYLERERSSLVYMADRLIRESENAYSGFYLNNYKELADKLKKLAAEGKKTLLLGVTYALLDLAEQFPQAIKNCVIMETGGMKGKRKEMIRDELHSILKTAFHVSEIHSEYGMTELLSQAYSKGNGIFYCPPWMKIKIREMNDPLSYAANEKTGGVNVIDFANYYSCSFIATSDLGKVYADGGFEILGRFDNSDVRGCNLMVE